MNARSLGPARLIAALALAFALTGCSVDMPAANGTAAPAADGNLQNLGNALGQIASTLGAAQENAGTENTAGVIADPTGTIDTPAADTQGAVNASEDAPDLVAAATGEAAANGQSATGTASANAQALADAGLVNLRQLVPGAAFDMRYATTKNFTGQAVYKTDGAYLMRPAAEALKAVQADLASRGLGLKVWDAYRPLSAQRRFWEIKPDPKYVAHPDKGSRHNKGYAVDVTLTDGNGRELEMPTAFDDFSSRAATNSTAGSSTARRNREILHEVMKKHGFGDISSEWWHFDFPGWNGKPNLDIDI